MSAGETCGGRVLWGGMAWLPHTPEQCARRRAALLGELRDALAKPKACPILQALHVGCGAAGIGATQEELDAIAAELGRPR